MILKLWDYDHATVILYFIIVIVSTMLAKMAQRKYYVDYENGIVYKKYCGLFFFLSFAVLAFFSATTSVGADRAAYAFFFRTSSFERVFTGSEPGFELIMFLFHRIIGDANIFLGAIGLLTVANVYKGIWDLRDDISLVWAVFIFVSQYYFQSYSLIRMYFAVSILILFAKYLKDGKFVKYFFVLILACTIHYSITFVVVGYVMSFVIGKLSKSQFEFKIVLLIIAAMVFSLFGVKVAVGLLSMSNAVTNKYSLYIDSISYGASYGVKWIFNVLPFALIFSYRKYFRKDMWLINLSVSYFLCTMVVSLLSYSISVIGRALVGFNLPMIIVLPMAFERLKKDYIAGKDVNSIVLSILGIRIRVTTKIIKIAMFLYFVVSFMLYLSDYMIIDAIDAFQFIWS